MIFRKPAGNFAAAPVAKVAECAAVVDGVKGQFVSSQLELICEIAAQIPRKHQGKSKNRSKPKFVGAKL
jgi:hypothetical protein